MGYTSNWQNRTLHTPSLRWLADLLAYLAPDSVIKIPTDYREKVEKVKDLLESDISGLVNSLLDFAISCAVTNFRIEADNKNVEEILNDWLNNINDELRGRIPVGIKALAREYFRERWKGSSFLLLRCVWDTKKTISGDLLLPKTMWFVDGEDIVVEDGDSEAVLLGDESYYLRISNKTKIELPKTDDETIFIQKPYNSWGDLYTTPFIIQRGIYKNLKLLQLLEEKGEYILTKALEYLFLLKKGTERLTLEGHEEFIYSEEDFRKIKDHLDTLYENRKVTSGLPSYITGFDTEIEHIIPDYAKILKQELYAPIERRILAGLGLIEIVEGIATTRREAILNPKAFINEIKAGVEDFKTLLIDIVKTILDKNADKHKKYKKVKINIYSPPIQQFINEEIKSILRSAYDRGVLSKQTFAEIVCEVDYDIERQRRLKEAKRGDDIIFYPPPIINKEGEISPQEEVRLKIEGEPPADEEVTDDKKGPEAVNYTMSKEYEQAPYNKISELPEQIKNVLPKKAQQIWLKAFNNAYDTYDGDETIAIKVAWDAVKKAGYMKDKKTNKWVKKRSKNG